MTKKDAIYRLKALSSMRNYKDAYGDAVDSTVYDEAVNMAIKALEEPDVPDTNVGKWIPFKDRVLEEPEKDEFPDQYRILDCPLPEDGQRILVSINCKGHESVQLDEFYTDDGAYLDSGYDLVTEATAWMPLPEPYNGGEENGCC